MKLRKLLNLMRNSKNLFKSFWNENPARTIVFEGAGWDSLSNKKSEKDKRIDKLPVEIFEEVITEEPKINTNLEVIKEQIKIVKERIKTLNQNLRNVNLKHEEMALGFLQARKKYLKHKDKFKWSVTTEDLIKTLTEKYKVKKVDINNYYRNIPKEGVDEIKKFGEALSCITDTEPIFSLIIDDGGKEEKKDPILLAQSPFGNWYYLLGAWDKEVEIVDDLIYKRK